MLQVYQKHFAKIPDWVVNQGITQLIQNLADGGYQQTQKPTPEALTMLSLQSGRKKCDSGSRGIFRYSRKSTNGHRK
jgi:hypothetical protein